MTDEKASESSLEPYAHLRHKFYVNTTAPLPSVSLWSILKHNVGRDLTKIALPVYVNEPISMLQRMAEDLTFAVLLDKALEHPADATQRMAYVAAFACSNYATTLRRTSKPFNPVLGETFEFVEPGTHGFRFIGEQVSHHPPVSAFHAESIRLNEKGKPTWEWSGSALVKTSFLGHRVDIRPTGTLTVTLRPDNRRQEHYTYEKVTTTIAGLMTGNLSMEHHGTMDVRCTQTDLTCTLQFQRPTRSWTTKASASNVVTGTIASAADKTESCRMYGEWSSHLTLLKQGKEIELWQHVPDADKVVDDRFHLTPFSVQLNDLPATLHSELPRTDSRFRPDMRFLEWGQFDKANEAKLDVEQRQRRMRQEQQAGQRAAFVPTYFAQRGDQDTADDGQHAWMPKRTENGKVTYWHERQSHGGAACMQDEDALFPLYAYS